MQRFFRQFIPFILIGIAIVAFAFGIILLAYLFLFGALIGLVLFIIAWIRAKFFPRTTLTKRDKNKTGRIIDSDEWNKL